MKEDYSYNSDSNESSVLSEQSAGYYKSNSEVQMLRNRIVDVVKNTDNTDMLMECLEVLHTDTMPCVYTDEELDEELRLSEASGNVSHEEALKYFAKWGFVR